MVAHQPPTGRYMQGRCCHIEAFEAGEPKERDDAGDSVAVKKRVPTQEI